jgi:prevent-host-death family protein
MITETSAVTFRQNLGEMLNLVQYRHDSVVINKDGKPVSLASYSDKDSAVKDRDEKHPDAEVHQVGSRGKVKGKFEEGAKVDRMVKHVKSSEKKLGHSDKEAENIAWATANKRGMLNNKNKKVDEESKGLWANIHAKRERIKHGSGEHMRKPGSKGAPTADALRKSAK